MKLSPLDRARLTRKKVPYPILLYCLFDFQGFALERDSLIISFFTPYFMLALDGRLPYLIFIVFLPGWVSTFSLRIRKATAESLSLLKCRMPLRFNQCELIYLGLTDCPIFSYTWNEI